MTANQPSAFGLQPSAFGFCDGADEAAAPSHPRNLGRPKAEGGRLSTEAGVSLFRLVVAARERFIRAGIPPDQARIDAEVLARHALGWDRATYLARRDDPLEGDAGGAARTRGRPPGTPRAGGVHHRRARVLGPDVPGHAGRAHSPAGNGVHRRSRAVETGRPRSADGESRTSAPAAAAWPSASHTSGPTPR